jgi:hypothetical protein
MTMRSLFSSSAHSICNLDAGLKTRMVVIVLCCFALFFALPGLAQSTVYCGGKSNHVL